MKKIRLGDNIFIKNRKEADFIWNILINLGYCWNSGKKDFFYYDKLPMVMKINDNGSLSFYKTALKFAYMLTINDFKNISLELE